MDERRGGAEIGNGGVGACGEQPLALAGIAEPGTVAVLVAAHGDGGSSQAFGLGDLDRTIAEGEQLRAGETRLAQEPLEDGALAEAGGIAAAAMDPRSEIWAQPEQGRLFVHPVLDRATEDGEHRPRARQPI